MNGYNYGYQNGYYQQPYNQMGQPQYQQQYNIYNQPYQLPQQRVQNYQTYQQPQVYQPPIQPVQPVQKQEQKEQEQIETESTKQNQQNQNEKKLLTIQQSILVKNLRVLKILLMKQNLNMTDEYEQDIQKYISVIKQQLQMSLWDNQKLKDFLEERGEFERVLEAYQFIVKQNIDNNEVVRELADIQQEVVYLMSLIENLGKPVYVLIQDLQVIVQRYQKLINQGGCPTEKWRGFQVLKEDIEQLEQQEDQKAIARQDTLLEDLQTLFEEDIKPGIWTEQVQQN